MNKNENLNLLVNGLLFNDPLQIVEFIKETNPQFLKTLLSAPTTETKKSFALSLLTDRSDISVENISKLILFFHSNGWNPTTGNFKNALNDFQVIWNSLRDIHIAEVTNLCDYDYLSSLNLDDDNNILLKAYNRNLPKTISILHKKNITDHNNPNVNSKILSLIKYKPELQKLYWNLNSEDNETFSESGFKNTKETLISILNRYSYEKPTENHISQITQYIDDIFPKTDIKQKEEIISLLTIFKHTKPLKHAITLYGSKLLSYKPTHVPIWANLESADTITILPFIFHQKIPLDSIHGDILYVEKIAENLIENDFSPIIDGTGLRIGRKRIKSKTHKINDIIEIIQDKKFLLQTNPQTGEPWFFNFSKNNQLTKMFYNSWMNFPLSSIEKIKDKNLQAIYNINYNLIDEEAKTRTQYSTDASTISNEQNLFITVLNRTYFYKDKNGKYGFEYLIQNEPYSILNFKSSPPLEQRNVSLVFQEALEIDKHINFISNEAKTRLLDCFIKNYPNDTISSYLKDHIHSLLDNLNTLNVFEKADFILEKDTLEAIEKFDIDLYRKLSYIEISKTITNDKSKTVSKSKI